jgi:histone demethylase JARID1
MILCDYCNGGYHTYCLDPPLAAVPTGDWFCAECTRTESSDTSFGFKEGFEHSLESFKQDADAWKKSYFGEGGLTDLTYSMLERAYWNAVTLPLTLDMNPLQVQYGSTLSHTLSLIHTLSYIPSYAPLILSFPPLRARAGTVRE